MTRGPLFAAGGDGEGQGTPRVARLVSGLGVWMAVKCRPWPEQLRWQCFKEEEGKNVYIGAKVAQKPAVRSVGSLAMLTPYVQARRGR